MADTLSGLSQAVFRIGLVGGGKGGAALLDLLLDWPEAHVGVVVDPRPDAPARLRAETLDIPTARHHLDVFKFPVDVVLEATGRPAVLDELLRARPAHVDVVGADSLRFFWALLQSHVRTARQLTVQLETQRALALENTQLDRRVEERTEKLTTLSALTQLIISARDVQHVFDEVAKAAATLLGGRLACVWVDDPVRGALRIQASFGVDPSVEAEMFEFREFAHGEGLIGSAFASRAPEYVADVQHDPRWLNKRLAKELGLHAYAAIPLMTGDRVAGALDLLFTHARLFTPEEKKLMTLLAGQATVAIANARLLEEAERRHRAAAGLAETGRLITQSLDSQEIAQRIADSLRALLGGQYTALFQMKADSEDLVAMAVSGDDGPTFAPHMVLPRGTGIAAVAVRERQAVATRDVLADSRIVLAPEVRDRIGGGGFRAGLAVPLIAQHRVIGALAVRDVTGRHWSREEIELARALADQAAVALENARLYGEARRREQHAQELARLAQVVTGSLDLPEVLERVARAATDLLPDSAARIWVVEGDHMVLRSETGTNSPPRSGRKIELALGEGLIGHVAVTRERLVIEDVLTDPRTVNVAWMREEGYVSALYIPLMVRDRLVGVSSLLARHRHRFDPEELDSLTSFANQAAIAIENAMLLQAARTHEGRLETLLQASCELSRIQPLESLLGGIAKACGDLLGSDSVGIRVLEGDDLVIAGSHGDAKEAMPSPRIKVGESLSGIVAATGELLVVRDPANDPRVMPAHRGAYQHRGWTSWLGVPIKLGEQLMGVVSLRSRREGGWSPDDLTIATAFASQAAVALENSRLYLEIRRAYDELTQTQDQLTQAQKMEAVGRLAGGIAHDFNNLLTVILGRTELLLQPLKPEDPLHRSIDLIRKTAGRAAELTRQLLAFSRKQVLQPKALDLNSVVSNMEQMLGRVIGEDISLVTVLDPTLGHVKADLGQIEQVVMNLAVNARDAMPQGGRLTIETANVELDAAYARLHVGASPGANVMLAVSDTGVGMPRDVQAHIFEPFFTTKEPGKGTGLGLATVYGVVKQTGGYVWVYSEPGQGAAFKIYLPRVVDAVETAARETVVTESPRGTETILLVEDEEGVRELTRDILRASGYTVVDAEHGGEALLACERHAGPIHLLMTDVIMPQMSGRELAERLTRLRPDMKVLYVSGYTDDAVVRHGVLESGTAFLQKPFIPDTVTRKVREVLDAPPSPSPGGPARA